MQALLQFLKNPARAVRRALLARKYRTTDGYDAERFWRERHEAYGFDLRGVGYTKLTHGENEAMYAQAREIFYALCREEQVEFSAARMLNIGCGAGFYAQAFREGGGKEYLGVDITDALIPKLREAFPEFAFRKLDASAQALEGVFDLIVMIDVTQHITNEAKFSFAMQNIRRSLAPQGLFLVTSWLDAQARDRFFERSRDLAAYQKEFPGYRFGTPRPFRDKFIFSIRPPAV